MTKVEDIRSYCNPWRGCSKDSQLAKLTGEIYEENKTGKVIDALIQSVRKGSIVEVVHMGLLAPAPAKKLTPYRRRKLLAQRVEQIKERGGIIRELSTGEQSNKGKCPSMLVRATEYIATSGRGAVKREGVGKPPIPLTQDEREKAEAIWTSRRYKNDAEREAAIKKKIGKTLKRGWCWSHFGSPSGKEPQAS